MSRPVLVLHAVVISIHLRVHAFGSAPPPAAALRRPGLRSGLLRAGTVGCSYGEGTGQLPVGGTIGPLQPTPHAADSPSWTAFKSRPVLVFAVGQPRPPVPRLLQAGTLRHSSTALRLLRIARCRLHRARLQSHGLRCVQAVLICASALRLVPRTFSLSPVAPIS
ncbi:hypothetical protein NQD34_009852 [Periophthalmus magnuspinnatus]|nr:hypothetical protein NQD34_009852 [Periophthalmus magnuspinnatus]